MDATITNIKRSKLTDQIYTTLKELILSEKWPVGFRVPSENELAAQFGVSRMSVRMALQKLQALGLVEVKVGDGSYVKEFSLSNFLSEIGELAFKTNNYREISQFRKAIELAALKMAIENGTEQDMNILESHLGHMLNAVRNSDDEEFFKWDFHFHRQICSMSGNRLFVTVYDICAVMMRRYYELNRHISPITSEDIEREDHYVLFQYIRARDYKKCAEYYSGMIDYPLEQNRRSSPGSMEGKG